ncbi:MAG TPA: hypothetical protein VKW08_15730 [Xanthobacteraceae bacterium]|jgi:hypothetical protein|nr:hypothetical protein [Xanthobacteraceae bacterium]
MIFAWKAALLGHAAGRELTSPIAHPQPNKEPDMHWLDPSYLPEICGTFARFLINPHGDADGMLLADGTQIHFPPHLSAEVRAAIPLGQTPTVRIRGVRTRGSDLIAAVAIETDGGRRVIDNGPPQEHDHNGHAHDKPLRRVPMQAEGRVRRALHGPRGEVRGALLEDGTIVCWPPHESESLAHLIRPSERLAARGEGLTTELGTVIQAREVGSSLQELRPLKPKKPKNPKSPKNPESDASSGQALESDAM